MAKTPPKLTEQELEIMKVVWDLGSTTVRGVYEALRTRRQIAYTTVLTMMKILAKKGHLKVSRADRAYVYRPARPRQRVLGEMVQEFVDRVFGGAAEPLVQHLVRDRHLNEDDLREIAKRIKDDDDEH
jgi:BlaI family penicillinase repressor